MAFSPQYSRETSVMSGPLEYTPAHPLAGGFAVIPEEVGLTHAVSGVQLGGSQRLADAAFSSWRSGNVAASATLTTSGLSLSTRSSDVDLKEFLAHRGRHQLQGLHKAAAQGDRIAIMHIMKQLGPDAPIDELDANGCTPLMYAVMSESRLAIEMLLNFSARREQVDSEGRTAVHYAAFYGKHKSLKFLIDTASDWLSRDLYGRTPMHWACCNKSTRCLSVLLKHAQTVFGDINPKDCEGMTPVHCAAQFGRPRHLMLLAEAGCDFTAVDVEQKTALHWTVSNKDSACVQVILETYPPLINRQDCNGSTLLHLAASHGSTHIVETLLSTAGIDIDAKDSMECTPLHHSSAGGHAEIAQLLLTFGALDACIDSQGFTALHYAVQSNSTATIEAFVPVATLTHLPDANESKTPLMNAAQSASHTILKILLENQAVLKTINYTDTDRQSALHLACVCGSEECTDILLACGADPNLQNSLLQTPLMIACIIGNTSCIHPLIAAGANPQIVDSEGHSALLKAVLYAKPSAVQSLILAGVDLNTQDLTGTTALHMAAYSGDTTIVRMLLENGAHPNLQDENGLSALHMTAVEGHTLCVSPLAQHGATLNLFDYSEERLTPLDYAVRNGHSECAEELKACGAVTVDMIKELAAISIQTVFRGFRARKLRESLKIQSQAVTVIAAHVRSFLQKKRYLEIKRRHYAAIKIQAVFRGYRERVIYKVKQAEAQEREKKQKKLEDFAQLVQKHKETLAPFPTKSPEKRPFGEKEMVNEKQLRLEVAMKMKNIYEEKQKKWEAFRAAERQRRVDKARQAEFDRLAGIMADSRARREYTRSKFHQTLSVRSHHHAAIVIQRAFREMKSRRWWRERVQVRLQFERRSRENRAAVKIQHAWRQYQQHKAYKAMHFKAVYTSRVVALAEPTPGKFPAWASEDPMYKRGITITGSPRRKVHKTLPGGFRVPRPAFQLPRALQPLSPHAASLSYPFPTRPRKQRSSTSPTLRFSPRGDSKATERALPELFARVSLTNNPKHFTRAPTKAFHLPQIVPY